MENYKWIVIALVIVSLLFWKDHDTLSNRIDDLNIEISNLEEEKNNYVDALDEVNSYVEEARSYAWSSYEEMGEALENLETINP